MALPNVVAPFRAGNCCAECGAAKPWAYRPKPQTPFDCGPVTTLELSQEAVRQRTLRSRLRQAVIESGLPKDVAAALLFNVPATRLHDFETGRRRMPRYTEDKVQKLESVERRGSYLTVVYNIGSPSDRWQFMLHRRARDHTAESAACVDH